MKHIETINGCEIFEAKETYGSDFYVYGIYSDPRVVPSLAMAREVAAAR